MSDENNQENNTPTIIKPKIVFQQIGNAYKVHEVYPSPGLTKLPPAIYSIVDHRMALQNPNAHSLKMDYTKFTIPTRLYGEHNARRDSVVAAFNESPGVTGALFLGLKGTGKTLLAQDICNRGVEMGFPVIYIPSDEKVDPYLLKQYLYNLGETCGGCVVFFDEFAKNYGNEKNSNNQNDFLNLFCDSELKKTLFVVVDNEKKEMNEYMLDRPRRFLFRIQYDGITKDLASELAQDHNLTLDLEREFVDYVSTNKISMDVAMTFIEIAKKFPTVSSFYQASAQYNIPPINGWDLSWKVEHHDLEGEYMPSTDLIASVSDNGNRIVGKCVINSIPYPVDLDLSVFEPTDFVYRYRTSASYPITVGPFKFTIVRHRSTAEDKTITHTLKVTEHNANQSKSGTVPKDHKETFPKEADAFTIDNAYLVSIGIKQKDSSGEINHVVGNALQNLGIGIADAEGRLNNSKKAKAATKRIAGTKRKPPKA